MVLEIPGGLFGQDDVRETPAATSSSSSSSTIIAPIGTILAWLKSYTNTPQALPTGWLECDGSAVSDAESVYDGQNLPDLNGNEFIRGAATSGGTGGGTTGAGSAHGHADTFDTENESTHEHDFSDTSTGPSGDIAKPAGEGAAVADNTHTHNVSGTTTNGDAHKHTISGSVSNESAHTHSSAPKYYDVVWIIRIK